MHIITQLNYPITQRANNRTQSQNNWYKVMLIYNLTEISVYQDSIEEGVILDKPSEETVY